LLFCCDAKSASAGHNKAKIRVMGRVSFEQPKLEPNLVSALSKTKTFVSVLRLNHKKTEEQPKQFDREHILVFFSEILGFFQFVLVWF
jgi:hypothetical protein